MPFSVLRRSPNFIIVQNIAEQTNVKKEIEVRYLISLGEIEEKRSDRVF